MDALARGGVILDSFYTQPICAATRSSIMTGRYVSRFGFQHFNPPKALGGVGAVPLSEKLMPQFLSEMGYDTHLVGKWHCGMIKQPYLPHNRGFNSTFGYYEGAIDYYNHTVGKKFLDLHAAKPGEEPQCLPQYKGKYDLDLWRQRAFDIIDGHGGNGRSLFMYLALHSVHEPDEVPQKWYAMYPNVTDTDNRRTMCAMVTAMDSAVGDVVRKWKAKGAEFWRSSLVLFHSDNGGPTYAGAGTSNWPLRLWSV